MTIGASFAGGNPIEARRKLDDYTTPIDVTHALAQVFPIDNEFVWEPACGEGAMATELMELGASVISTDIFPYGFGEVQDFLKTKRLRAPRIITNPPFKWTVDGQTHKVIEFIDHAFSLGVQEMALVLKSSYWQASTRYEYFSNHKPAIIAPLLWRPDFRNLGGPVMEFMWCIWKAAHVGDPAYRPLHRPRVERRCHRLPLRDPDSLPSL